MKEPQSNEPNDVEAIYQRYLQAFKKGVYNYIKEGIDPITKETMPRKYFSGGTNFGNKVMAAAYRTTTDLAMLPQDDLGHEKIISITVNPVESGLLPKNHAMVGRGSCAKAGTYFFHNQSNTRNRKIYRRAGVIRYIKKLKMSVKSC